jgi:1,4-dihydroxy-2-naphthoate octaprenyltransferase
MESPSTGASSGSQKSPGKIELFLRLTRLQFIPLIVLPGAVGTSLAYAISGKFDPIYFGLVLLGIVLLHLGANAIDDCYDYQNGVDQVANSFFPSDFGGWKPIPRGYIPLRNAKIVSYSLFAFSLAIGVFFWFRVGPIAFVLAFSGFLLALFYCAPPLKLDYRGLGLGELSIFFSFGPIPVLGAFYVQTASLNISALLVSIPIGIMTVTILIYHDLIFSEVYAKSKKMSLATVIGRRRALQSSLALTMLSYAIVILYVVEGILPIWSLLSPLASGLILLRKRKVFSQPNKPPPFYLPFTVNGLLSDWMFSFILALSILI